MSFILYSYPSCKELEVSDDQFTLLENHDAESTDEDQLIYLSPLSQDDHKEEWRFNEWNLDKLNHVIDGDGKKVYQVPVEWAMCGRVEVVAENPEKAKELALLKQLPHDSDYIDGSFQVNEDLFDQEV
jgi:hypothetical protein